MYSKRVSSIQPIVADTLQYVEKHKVVYYVFAKTKTVSKTVCIQKTIALDSRLKPIFRESKHVISEKQILMNDQSSYKFISGLLSKKCKMLHVIFRGQCKTNFEKHIYESSRNKLISGHLSNNSAKLTLGHPSFDDSTKIT